MEKQDTGIQIQDGLTHDVASMSATHFSNSLTTTVFHYKILSFHLMKTHPTTTELQTYGSILSKLHGNWTLGRHNIKHWFEAPTKKEKKNLIGSPSKCFDVWKVLEINIMLWIVTHTHTHPWLFVLEWIHTCLNHLAENRPSTNEKTPHTPCTFLPHDNMLFLWKQHNNSSQKDHRQKSDHLRRQQTN